MQFLDEDFAYMGVFTLKYSVCAYICIFFCMNLQNTSKNFSVISAYLYKDNYLSLWRKKNINVELRWSSRYFYLPLSCNAICCLCSNAISRPKAFFCLSSSFRSTKIFNCRHSLSFFYIIQSTENFINVKVMAMNNYTFIMFQNK